MDIKELLKDVREDIDKIDDELIKLFVKRMECSQRVAEVKIDNNIPVFNKIREDEILEEVEKKAGIYGHEAVNLYSSIFKISRERQHNMVNKSNEIKNLLENSPSELCLENKKIMCQGVVGAYSHKAAKTFFGEDANISFVPQFKNVFEEVAAMTADYGVVPMENSAAGSVSEVYGLIMKHKFYIVGSVSVFVKHCLCAKKGTEIKKVISHPQALLQCGDYILNHGYEKSEFSNTAAAAKYISENDDFTTAVICSKDAGEKYGLEIIEEGIQDSENNHTRFAIISKEPVFLENADKISLSFILPNEPGSLSGILERFSLAGLNLTKIESRPIKNSDFDYEFYLDFTGNVNNEKVLNIMETLNTKIPVFNFLGNYREIK